MNERKTGKDDWAAFILETLGVKDYLEKISAARIQYMMALSKKGGDRLFSVEVYALKLIKSLLQD